MISYVRQERRKAKCGEDVDLQELKSITPESRGYGTDISSSKTSQLTHPHMLSDLLLLLHNLHESIDVGRVSQSRQIFLHLLDPNSGCRLCTGKHGGGQMHRRDRLAQPRRGGGGGSAPEGKPPRGGPGNTRAETSSTLSSPTLPTPHHKALTWKRSIQGDRRYCQACRFRTSARSPAFLEERGGGREVGVGGELVSLAESIRFLE